MPNKPKKQNKTKQNKTGVKQSRAVAPPQRHSFQKALVGAVVWIWLCVCVAFVSFSFFWIWRCVCVCAWFDLLGLIAHFCWVGSIFAMPFFTFLFFVLRHISQCCCLPSPLFAVCVCVVSVCDDDDGIKQHVKWQIAKSFSKQKNTKQNKWIHWHRLLLSVR